MLEEEKPHPHFERLRSHVPHMHVPRLRPPRKAGLEGDLEAAKIAVKGFGQMVRSERPVRYHLLVHSVMVPVGMKLRFNWLEWVIYTFAGERMLSAELNNSVHEAAANRQLKYEAFGSKTDDDGVKVIKDWSAGTTVAPVSVYVGVVASLVWRAVRRRRR